MKTMTNKALTDDVSTEQLITDFKVVVADAEALLVATANLGGDKLTELRAKAETSLKVAKAKMAETQAVLLDKTKAAAQAADNYVHDNPWQAVGIAASIGLVVGLVVGRR